MPEILSDNVWERLKDAAQEACTRKAAVAYLTDAEALPFGANDILIVDASDACIQGGQTSAKALTKLHQRGVIMYSYPHLHAKIFVFDSAVIVGSTNLSKASQNILREVAILSNERTTINAAKLLIETFVSEAVPINASFIARISQIPVDERVPVPKESPESTTDTELKGTNNVEGASIVPSLVEDDLFEPNLKKRNRIQMAAPWLVEAFSRIEEVNNNSRFVPAYVANIIWTCSGGTVKTNIPEQPVFSSPDEIYKRAAKISKKHEARIKSLLKYIIESDATPANACYWAKRALES